MIVLFLLFGLLAIAWDNICYISAGVVAALWLCELLVSSAPRPGVMILCEPDPDPLVPYPDMSPRWNRAVFMYLNDRITSDELDARDA